MRAVALALAVVLLGCKRDDREVIFADPTPNSTEPRAQASGPGTACEFGKITARVGDEDDEAQQPMCTAMRAADRCLTDASTDGTELHFDIEVASDGRVTVTKSEPGGDSAQIACIASVLRSATFPAGVEREFCYFVTVP